jgi:hypothetical protein
MEAAICEFIQTHLSDWRGLQPFPLSEIPACLGILEKQGELEFGLGVMPYRIFHTDPGGPEVWLFSLADEHVHLVEVFSATGTPSDEALFRQFGTPEMRYPYPLAAQLQRSLGEPEESLEELVYASRGLAGLIGRKPGSGERLLRLRGFEAMPIEQYYAKYVDLPPVRFFLE